MVKPILHTELPIFLHTGRGVPMVVLTLILECSQMVHLEYLKVIVVEVLTELLTTTLVVEEFKLR